jgi:hypothetical protein
MWRIAVVLLLAAQPLPSITINGDADAARILQLSASDAARLRSSGVLATRKTAPPAPDVFFKYPVPQSVAANAKARAELRAQGVAEREIHLGDSVSVFAESDGGYWFGKAIKNYEGESGRGAIGFLTKDGRYTMLELPALQTSSVSAILAEPDAIWAGMYRQAERSQTARGLLRYDRQSQTARTFPVPYIIHTIVRAGTRVFVGTVGGPYMISGDTVTRLVWK